MANDISVIAPLVASSAGGGNLRASRRAPHRHRDHPLRQREHPVPVSGKRARVGRVRHPDLVSAAVRPHHGAADRHRCAQARFGGAASRRCCPTSPTPVPTRRTARAYSITARLDGRPARNRRRRPGADHESAFAAGWRAFSASRWTNSTPRPSSATNCATPASSATACLWRATWARRRTSRTTPNRLGAPIAIIDKRRPDDSENAKGGGSHRRRCRSQCPCSSTTRSRAAGTMIAAAEFLLEHGAQRIEAAAVHPVLSGHSVRTAC